MINRKKIVRNARLVLKRKRAAFAAKHPGYVIASVAAKKYKVTAGTLQRWAACGLLPARRDPETGMVLLRPSDIERKLLYG
jgi:hypothetical protein